MPAAPGPLDGVRILDLTSVVMGPYATQTLGDLGADVIVVEGTTLEANRAMGPGPHPQLSGVALNLLRNKRSLRLDFKHPDGHDALLRVAATCDVVITNIRPAALARAGLRYEDLTRVRPDVIYCEAHGYPTGTDRADEPAYDDVIQAASGIADAARLQTGEPSLVPMIVVDKLCGLTIAYAVAAALYRRARTGRGEHIEVPMAATASAFVLAEHGSGAIPEPPVAAAGYARVLAAHRQPQRTADGWIEVMAYTRDQFSALFAACDPPVDEALYASGRARSENIAELYRIVTGLLATRTTDEWLAYCRDAGVPATAITPLADLVAELPLAEHPAAGPYRVIPPPVRFAEAPASVRRAAPLVGEHTDEILAEAGLDPGAIAGLRRAGAVPPEPEDR